MANVEKDLLQSGKGQQNLPAFGSIMSTSIARSSICSPVSSFSLRAGDDEREGDVDEGENGGDTKFSVSRVRSCNSESDVMGSLGEWWWCDVEKSFCPTEKRYSFSALRLVFLGEFVDVGIGVEVLGEILACGWWCIFVIMLDVLVV